MLTASLSVHPDPESVVFELVVENRGDDPVELSFRTSQRAEFTVYSTDDEPEAANSGEVEPVWRSGEGEMFAQMLGSETVDPGESIGFRDAWPSPSPGEYRVVGEVVCTDRELSAEETFVV